MPSYTVINPGFVQTGLRSPEFEWEDRDGKRRQSAHPGPGDGDAPVGRRSDLQADQLRP